MGYGLVPSLYQWLWVTMELTFAVWNLCTAHIRKNVAQISYTQSEAYAAYNMNYRIKSEGFLNVTCTVKVVIHRRRCKTDTLLLRITNMKLYIASRIVPFPMTLSDFQGHWLLSSPFKCDFSYSFAALGKILTDVERRAVPLRQPSFLFSESLPGSVTKEWQSSRMPFTACRYVVSEDFCLSSRAMRRSVRSSAAPSLRRRR